MSNPQELYERILHYSDPTKTKEIPLYIPGQAGRANLILSDFVKQFSDSKPSVKLSPHQPTNEH